MDSARKLFDTLVALKQPDCSGRSAEIRLIDYCKQVLGAMERFHWDFKEKRNRSNSALEDDDKKNLAKAVSGFANSGGGVIIWGIENQTLSPKPISGIKEFVQSLLQLATQVTDPVVPSIDGDWIPSENSKGDTGFGLMYVPESPLPPHRVVLDNKEVRGHYYTRTGESFVVASHTQLEDMFGRRPKPVLALKLKMVYRGTGPSSDDHKMCIVLAVDNKGRGPARAPFLCVRIHPPYKISTWGLDGNGHVGLQELSAAAPNEKRYGASAHVVIHGGVDHDVTAVDVKFRMGNEPKDLKLDYRIVAEGVMPIEGEEVLKGADMQAEAMRRLTQSRKSC